MPRLSLSRFASLFAALALAALAACAPAMVPAPVSSPQPPYYGYGRVPPPPVPPGPAAPPATAGRRRARRRWRLLVPLSGANAELGQAILDAAQLALFESGGDRLVLVPRDTGGNAAGAASAARAVIGDGARLILGPLLAPEVEAVKPIAQEAHINVIAFSTVTNLAGGNVYLMGFLPRQEVVREVGYARQRGLDRFAALAPNSPYGHLMADALREVAPASGGSVVKVEFFDPRAGDVSPAIQRLMPGGAAEDSAAAASGASERLAFDALLLPEGGAKLKQIARQSQGGGRRTANRCSCSAAGSGTSPISAASRRSSAAGSPRHRRKRGRISSGGTAPPTAITRRASPRSATMRRRSPRCWRAGRAASRSRSRRSSTRAASPASTGCSALRPMASCSAASPCSKSSRKGPVVVSPAPQSFQDVGY